MERCPITNDQLRSHRLIGPRCVLHETQSRPGGANHRVIGRGEYQFRATLIRALSGRRDDDGCTQNWRQTSQSVIPQRISTSRHSSSPFVTLYIIDSLFPEKIKVRVTKRIAIDIAESSRRAFQQTTRTRLHLRHGKKKKKKKSCTQFMSCLFTVSTFALLLQDGCP